MGEFNETNRKLAEAFAEGVLDAIRNATLEEIIGTRESPTTSRTQPSAKRPLARRGRPGRPPSPSIAAAIADVTKRMIGVLQKHPNGLRAERLRAELGIPREKMTAAVHAALESKQITKRGERRATTYLLTKYDTKAAETATKSGETTTPAAPKPKKRRGALVVLTDAGKAAERGEPPQKPE
jgi:hypothetical protein